MVNSSTKHKLSQFSSSLDSRTKAETSRVSIQSISNFNDIYVDRPIDENNLIEKNCHRSSKQLDQK